MFEKLPHIVSASLFSICAIGIWAVWSLPAFLQNNPADFQASGSIIVAYAIYSYGRDRTSRERAVAKSQENALISSHNMILKRLEFQESLAENTSNMHSLSYLKLCKALGLRDDAVGDQDAAISVLEQNMREYMEHYTLYDKLVNAYEHAEEDR